MPNTVLGAYQAAAVLPGLPKDTYIQVRYQSGFHSRSTWTCLGENSAPIAPLSILCSTERDRHLQGMLEAASEMRWLKRKQKTQAWQLASPEARGQGLLNAVSLGLTTVESRMPVSRQGRAGGRRLVVPRTSPPTDRRPFRDRPKSRARIPGTGHARPNHIVSAHPAWDRVHAGIWRMAGVQLHLCVGVRRGARKYPYCLAAKIEECRNRSNLSSPVREMTSVHYSQVRV